jgi:methylmalonyl-CoA/ethylmalonyl-CoA epimerase
MTDFTFHHVGVGTSDFDGAIQAYSSIGHRLHRRVDDPVLNVRVAFLACPLNVGPWIEILSPLNPGGPLQSLIERKVLPSPYHTCYRVSELNSAAEVLRSHAFFPVGEPRPALAFDNARVAFFYHAALGLLELVESPPPWPAG